MAASDAGCNRLTAELRLQRTAGRLRYIIALVVTPEEYVRARRLLLRRDPVLAALIRAHGAVRPRRGAACRPLFGARARDRGQQLSTKAAATIYARLLALMPGGVPTPEHLAALTDEQLRGAGISRQKSA